MNRKLQRIFENTAEKLKFYFSDYYISRLILNIRVEISWFFFPIPSKKDEEDSKDYIERLTPDQALRYCRFLLEIWSQDAKLFDQTNINHLPKKKWEKRDKRRREVYEGLNYAEFLYARALERKKQAENS